MPDPDHKDPSLFSAIFAQETRQFAITVGTLLKGARDVMTADDWFTWLSSLPIPTTRAVALIEYVDEEALLVDVTGPKAETLVWGPQRRSDLPYVRVDRGGSGQPD